MIDWSNGSRTALDALMPAVYGELRRLAARYLSRERSDHTLQPTALVNEAYLRLIDQHSVRWQNRAHFYGIAAQLMRRILVDHARGQAAAKRGGTAATLPLDQADAAAAPPEVDVVALDEALARLSAFDERQGRLVELRFFGGLTIEESAEVLGVSAATVKREWALAKAWLYRELNQGSRS